MSKNFNDESRSEWSEVKKTRRGVIRASANLIIGHRANSVQPKRDSSKQPAKKPVRAPSKDPSSSVRATSSKSQQQGSKTTSSSIRTWSPCTVAAKAKPEPKKILKRNMTAPQLTTKAGGDASRRCALLKSKDSSSSSNPDLRAPPSPPAGSGPVIRFSDTVVKYYDPESGVTDHTTLKRDRTNYGGNGQRGRLPLIRRKSYESLEIVNGRATSTNCRSARQKMLRAYLPRRRFSQSAIQPIKELLQEIEDEDKERRKASATAGQEKASAIVGTSKGTKANVAAPPRQRRRPPRTKDPKVKGKRGKPGSGKPGPVGSTQIRGKGPTGGSTKPLVGRGSTSEDHSDNCNEYDDKDEDDEAFYSMSREEQLQHLKDKSQDDLAQELSRDWVGLRSLTGTNVSGWKFQDNFYGNFNVGRRPAMDTAWGRRVYNQYEIEFEVDKPKHTYLTDTNASSSGQQSTSDTTKADLTERQRLQRTLGLWDVIYSRDVVPVVEAVRKWDADHEEKEKQLRKLNVDLAEIEAEVVAAGDREDPINKFRRLFCKAGTYLRPDDLKYCLSKTNFTEEQIIEWFQRFRKDCPDGRLTIDHLRKLFRQAFPNGNAEKFSQHIMRIFDSDGNSFLDFREFLMAIDIATCTTEESKLTWAFKLFDVDNDGVIDLQEMAAIMETLESLESSTSNKKGPERETASDPEGLAMSAMERAKNLFAALDVDDDGLLTMEEFVAGYMERTVLQAKQDAQEQKQHIDWLVFRGPHVVPDKHVPEMAADGMLDMKLARMISGMIFKRLDIEIDESDGDMPFVGIREANENRPRGLLVRFRAQSTRDQIWSNRREAKKSGLIIEEWLTEHRYKLHKKCKELKMTKDIKDVVTEDGDIYAILHKRERPAAQGSPEVDKMADRLLVVTDADYETLVKITKKTKVDDVEGVATVAVSPASSDAS